MRRRCVVPIAMVCFLIYAPAQASTVIPITLEETVRASGVIFAGTVRSIDSDIVNTEALHTIVSTVVFADVQGLDGASSRSPIALRIQGGEVGGQGVSVDGLPRLERGRRYIVLASADLGSERNGYLPIVGLYFGLFRVHQSENGKAGLVSDWAGREVVDVIDGRLRVVGRPVPVRRPAAVVREVRDYAGRHDSTTVPLRSHRARELSSRGLSAVTVLTEEEAPPSRMTEQEFLAILRTLKSYK